RRRPRAPARPWRASAPGLRRKSLLCSRRWGGVCGVYRRRRRGHAWSKSITHTVAVEGQLPPQEASCAKGARLEERPFAHRGVWGDRRKHVGRHVGRYEGRQKCPICGHFLGVASYIDKT